MDDEKTLPENNETNTDTPAEPESLIPAPSANVTETQPAETPEPDHIIFTPRDWLAVVLGLALAALWLECFSMKSLINVPGLGTAAFVLAALASEVIYLGRKIRPTRAGAFLAVCTALIAVSCGLFGDYSVRMLDLALLSFLTPASALALSGRGFPDLKAGMVGETFRLFIPNLFRHFLKPFKTLRRRDRSWTWLGTAVVTLILLIPVLFLVLTLLSSADQVFEGLLGSIGDAFLNGLRHGAFLWDWVRIIVFGLMLFSFLYSLARPAPDRDPASPEPLKLPSWSYAAALAVLDLIYAVFAGIQIVFLFGGRDAASMHGGFAEYARSGFFQLVAVSGINLFAALLSVTADGKGVGAVKALVYVLLGLTYVILVSACYRMCLYINEFGLSLLRCMTLVIMLWLAICLAAAALKVQNHSFKVFPVFLASGLALWVIFNYVNIDKVIGTWNRQAFEAGELSEYDYVYVNGLGPDRIQNDSLHWSNRVLFPMDTGTDPGSDDAVYSSGEWEGKYVLTHEGRTYEPYCVVSKGDIGSSLGCVDGDVHNCVGTYRSLPAEDFIVNWLEYDGGAILLREIDVDYDPEGLTRDTFS